MIEFFCAVIGGAVTWAAMTIRARSVRVAAKQIDKQKYEQLWLEATELLRVNGQLTDKQLALITPRASEPAAKKKRLPRGSGASWDRRRVEVTRAQNGLPPADNLKGMHSADARIVREARIKHGTDQ
jgi:hypothetical protein